MFGGGGKCCRERDSGQVSSASFHLTRRRGAGSHVCSRSLQRRQGRKGAVQAAAPGSALHHFSFPPHRPHSDIQPQEPWRPVIDAPRRTPVTDRHTSHRTPVTDRHTPRRTSVMDRHTPHRTSVTDRYTSHRTSVTDTPAPRDQGQTHTDTPTHTQTHTDTQSAKESVGKRFFSTYSEYISLEWSWMKAM